jgi:hypothetical protein
MIAAIVTCTLVGALLGSRFRIFVILPAAFALFFIAIGELAFLGATSLIALASMAALQIGYLAGCFCRVLIAPSAVSFLYSNNIGVPANSNNVLFFRPNRHGRI